MNIALIGNQNSGKTTLFNCLTGMNAKVGNWPGVTIEKKVGVIKGTTHKLVDLPGIYSLSSYSIEEKISKEYILKENPDLIINTIDATSLERSLYLTTELLSLDINMIIVLNMVDMLEKKKIAIDTVELEKKLGIKVFKISAVKKTGVQNLIHYIKSNLFNNTKRHKIKVFDEDIESNIKFITGKLSKNIKHPTFITLEILQDDETVKTLQTPEFTKIRENIEERYKMDIDEIIATQRYNYIDNILVSILKRKVNTKSLSDKLDRIFLNKYLSIPIFLLVIFFIYFVAVEIVGEHTSTYTDSISIFLYNVIAKILDALDISIMIKSLILDGILKGVGEVLKFIPQLSIIFLCICILETTGYMARIALLLDKFFRKIGLNGKSIISFILGFGCSVPRNYGK